MTEIAATAIPLHQTPGKRNMASAAFAELRAARAEGRAPEGSELSFADLVDTINPLQHIPVVSDIYRHLTGDALSPQSRVAGGILFGGVIGGVASVLSLAISGDGEKGLGDTLLASVLGGEEEPAAATALAEAPKEADAAPEAPLVTASLAPSRPAQAPAKPAPAAQAAPAAPASMSPSLSPEAFNALLGAFADPAPLRDAEARLTMGSGDDESDEAVILSAPGGAALADASLITAMQQAMDKYQAMQSVTR
ncbi:MAG: hypothetical protein KF765_02265 [Parvibaculaceae bacterium]|nr:hypothetical protein [Parvibaculaceae bacterium]